MAGLRAYFALSDKLISENPIPLQDERLVKHVGEKFPRLQNKQDSGKLLRNLVEYGAVLRWRRASIYNYILHNGLVS